MSEDRTRILNLLAEGKISVDEAERLLGAVAAPIAGAPEAETVQVDVGPRTQFSYLRIVVEPIGEETKGNRVNIRIPLRLLRAGMKLSGLLPKAAGEKVQSALAAKGIELDLSAKGDALKDLIAQLADMTIDVESDNERVRVYCE